MKSYNLALGRQRKSLPEDVEVSTDRTRIVEGQKANWKLHPTTVAMKEELEVAYELWITSAINNAEAGDKERAVINLIKAKTIKERLMSI